MSAYSPYCRLYNPISNANLVLDGCSVQALISDVHASVILSQRFTSPAHWNDSVSVVYAFGLMADAAVCGFEMVRQDGTKIEGIVKEKQEAKHEYDEAIKAGQIASLGQQETADVFSIAVGNIFPSETVTINLRYVLPLIDDEDTDQVKFIFPRTYTQRYGAAPTFNSAQGRTANQSFQINVIVQQAGTIKSISCPSGHPISLEFGIPDSISQAATSSSHYAKVSLADSTGFLTQDVVLVIRAMGLDAPRCFIEQHPSPEHETTAMALTFVPRFNIPDADGGIEYVFLVDRSGSMGGSNLRLVQEALVVLLRGLPSVGTTFNIVSFGTRATKLWENSREYSQMTLEEATKHVESMNADYGGTEIASALHLVYESLPKPLARPVSMFLFTDGSAWDVSTCVRYTCSALTTLPQSGNPKSFIRVFTIGIGDGASSDTCESIARAGGGFAVYVKHGEAVIGKCTRLVKAARTPEVKVEVEWGANNTVDSDDDFVIVTNDSKSEAQSTPDEDAFASIISLFGDANATDADNAQLSYSTGPPHKLNPTLPLPARIQQSPLVIPSIFPGTRTQIYAIIRTPKDTKMPTGIKVKGVVTSTGALVELVVPVSIVLSDPCPNSSALNPNVFLHTLAAKTLIAEREGGSHAFSLPLSALFEATDSELKTAHLEKDIIRLGKTYGLASKHTSFLAVDPSKQKIIIPVRARASTSNSGYCANIIGTINWSSRVRSKVVTRRPHIDGGLRESGSGDGFDHAVHSTSSAGVMPSASESSCGSVTLAGGPLLVSIARLQQWHGGFLLSSFLLDLIGNNMDHLRGCTIGDFEAKLSKHTQLVDRDVGATLCTVIWMEKYGGEEALDMKKKAEAWVKAAVGEERMKVAKEIILKTFGA